MGFLQQVKTIYLKLNLKTKKLNAIIILGLIATIGILVAQLLWTQEAYQIEEKKFSQTIHTALLEVVKQLYQGTNHELPPQNPIKKIANDYYIVNIDNEFEPEILEFYLKTEFKKNNINTDFEYALYNCQADEMVYGDYITTNNSNKTEKKSVYFPKQKNLIYYFAIRFPSETTYLMKSLKFWFVLSVLLVFILIIYVYSIYTIIQQKKYSELQQDFINNMTHEFKTPLTSILIAANFLKNQTEIIKNPKLLLYNQIIIKQSQNLNMHIEKILNLAKSDYEPLKISKTKIPINKTIAEVSENIMLKYPETIIQFVTNNNYYILADSFHFGNIIYNLMDNAIKYCIEKPIIKIEIIEKTNILSLLISDNGIGIDKKNIPFIFDKFYRISTNKTNEVNGFGLGLHYVKKICDQHNWKILVQSNQTNGSDFKIFNIIVDAKK